MDLARNSDNLHYTTDSQKIIGARVANAIQWYYDQTADKADYYMGPRITGAQFADARSTMIDVTIAHTAVRTLHRTSGITGLRCARRCGNDQSHGCGAEGRFDDPADAGEGGFR